jgi:hypothetical protein
LSFPALPFSWTDRPCKRPRCPPAHSPDRPPPPPGTCRRPRGRTSRPPPWWMARVRTTRYHSAAKNINNLLIKNYVSMILAVYRVQTLFLLAIVYVGQKGVVEFSNTRF